MASRSNGKYTPGCIAESWNAILFSWLPALAEGLDQADSPDTLSELAVFWGVL